MSPLTREGAEDQVLSARRRDVVVPGHFETRLETVTEPGHYENRDLHYAGKVGTGFDRETLHSLGRRLRELERDSPPFADVDPIPRSTRWVEPELVAQIAFTEWTRDGRLRHPRFLGLRDDKPAREVVRERPS